MLDSAEKVAEQTAMQMHDDWCGDGGMCTEPGHRHATHQNIKFITKALRLRDRETEQRVWGEAADEIAHHPTGMNYVKEFRRKAQECSDATDQPWREDGKHLCTCGLTDLIGGK